MPDPTTHHQLEALIEVAADMDDVQRRIWQAWERDQIGSAACMSLLGKVRERRQADAAERRRLAEEFDRAVPAAEGVEAPEERGDAWEEDARDGW